jgi:hypothetical protein
MRGRELMFVLALAGSVTACHKGKAASPASDQNMAVGGPMTNETMANADIETLPPDESSTTPSNQLESGADAPDVNDLDASSNSD